MNQNIGHKKTEFPQTRSFLNLLFYYVLDLGYPYQQHNANIN